MSVFLTKFIDCHVACRCRFATSLDHLHLHRAESEEVVTATKTVIPKELSESVVDDGSSSSSTNMVPSEYRGHYERILASSRWKPEEEKRFATWVLVIFFFFVIVIFCCCWRSRRAYGLAWLGWREWCLVERIAHHQGFLRELGQASEHANEETADDFDDFMSSLTEFDLTGFLDEVV